MRALWSLLAAAALAGSGGIAVHLAARGADQGPAIVVTVQRDSYPDGTPRLEAEYADGARHGRYRTWYRDGRPYEERNYVNGREEGRQRSWTPDGVLFLNYEMRNGRRYGFVNAQPCLTASGDSR